MATSEKQRELDKIKWEKSVMLGLDACGTFDYCQCCDKGIENPCECAHNRFYNISSEHKMVVEIINEDLKEVNETKDKKPAKKSTTKKTASKKTVTKAKSTAQKTTKKSTAKKTTKK